MGQWAKSFRITESSVNSARDGRRELYWDSGIIETWTIIPFHEIIGRQSMENLRKPLRNKVPGLVSHMKSIGECGAKAEKLHAKIS